jgi:hypothetical protein
VAQGVPVAQGAPVAQGVPVAQGAPVAQELLDPSFFLPFLISSY